MAALDKNLSVGHTHESQIKHAALCAAAQTFYAGAIVWWDRTSGQRLTITPAAGDRVAGIVSKKQVTTAADQLVEFFVFGIVELPAIANIDAVDLGDGLIFDVSTAITDNPADAVQQTGTTLAAGDAYIGRIVGISNGRPQVFLGPGTGNIYDATAAAFL